MGVVRWIRKTSRLSAMIDQPGGATVGRTLQKVDAAMGDLRAEGVAVIDAAVTGLEQRLADPGFDRAAWLGELYTLASEVLDAAGPLGFEDLGKAAFSLCDLVERLGAAGRGDNASLEVHVRAMRLLLANPELGAAGRAQILGGLDSVLGRVPRAEAD